MMAHVNTAGIHVPLWLDASDPAIGWGVDRVNYPMQEGTFFGDIIDTGSLATIGKPSLTGPVASTATARASRPAVRASWRDAWAPTRTGRPT